jgi:membrane protein insertase Oxa1/YidC/SpoIIIJ
MMGIKMKLLQPDMDKSIATIKRHSQQGNTEAAKIERKKIKKLRNLHGVYPMLGLASILQLPFHITWMSLINRLAFSHNDNPALTTDGLLWFKDLTAPDPTGVLPIVGSLITMLNIMTSSTSTTSATARKMRRYLFVLPMLSAPIWMTFPAVSLTSSNQMPGF